jgi:hypothetical protein
MFEVRIMRNRRWLWAGLFMLCCWLAVQGAAQGVAGTQDEPAAPAGDEQALDVRYAKAYLNLVEATLAKYQEPNRRQPNMIRRGVISALEETVREAQERVQLAVGDDKNQSAIYVASAEAALRAAQESLRKAETANRQRPGTTGTFELARLKAEIDLAKVRVDKANHLASESPLSNVEYELEQLREDVQELRLIVALLRDRN